MVSGPASYQLRVASHKVAFSAPLLFLIYIDDMKNALTSSRSILYADDTNIFLSGKDITQLTDTFNSELARLNEWFAANRLSLNLSKTHSMFFSLNTQLSLHSPNLSINNTRIETVSHSKFLGIHIDNKLTWSKHTSHVSSKISKSIGILKKVAPFLNRTTLFMLYNSFVLPYLSYGNIIWGCAASTHISRLFLLQKKALRIICNTNRLAHTNDLFLHNRILKIADINIYLCAQFVFKLHHHLFPTAFSNAFRITPIAHAHQTRAISNHTATIPFSRTSLRQKTLAIVAPKMFNSSICRSNDIINTHSFPMFKKFIFNLLVENYNTENLNEV